MNERLELLRDEKELTKKQIANIIGVVKSVYCEWENNKLTIPTKRLYQISNFFEVNIDYIVGLSSKRLSAKAKTPLNINLVATRLKEVRVDLNLTMRELATILNTSSSAISNYENGKFLILSPFFNRIIQNKWIFGRLDIRAQRY